jgi:hypothetical protein
MFLSRGGADFKLLSRDHIIPPGLFVVDKRDKPNGRAPNARRPGANPVDTRDKHSEAAGLSLLSENSENSPLSEEEENRYAQLRHYLEDKCPESDYVSPGREPDVILRRLARILTDSGMRATCKAFDRATCNGQSVRVPSGARLMERMAVPYLPKHATAL